MDLKFKQHVPSSDGAADQETQSSDPDSLVLTIVVLPTHAINESLALIILHHAEPLPARLHSRADNHQFIFIEPSDDTLLRLGSSQCSELRQGRNTTQRLVGVELDGGEGIGVGKGAWHHGKLGQKSPTILLVGIVGRRAGTGTREIQVGSSDGADGGRVELAIGAGDVEYVQGALVGGAGEVVARRTEAQIVDGGRVHAAAHFTDSGAVGGVVDVNQRALLVYISTYICGRHLYD